MINAGRVRVPALRMLTLSMLIKAIVSAVMCACAAAASFSLYSSGRDIPGLIIISAIVQTIGLFNGVVCILSLSRVSVISKRFESACKAAVVALFSDCLILLLTGVEAWLLAGSFKTPAAVVDWMILAGIFFKRLILSTAFLQIMKGFSEILRENGDRKRAAASERTGNAYMCCNAIGVVLLALFWAKVSVLTHASSAAVYLSCTVIEFIMYRIASEAAFTLWRARFSDSMQQGV